MKFAMVTLLASVLSVGTLLAADGSLIFLPQDGKSFEIGQSDVVRVLGPGASTGHATTVKVNGPAKAVVRPTASIVNGKTVPGGDSTEVDITPVKGKTGKVTVKLTITSPGGKVEEKEYEFEVK